MTKPTEAIAAAPQPVPGAQPDPAYITVNARDIAIALNGYAGFTGDPISFASELHERLRRTVFADGRPAPDLAVLRKRLGEAAALHLTAAAQRDRLRELLDEIGVMAANAPEDDAFAVCEEILVRIAAAGVPGTTPIGEWQDPESPARNELPS